MELDPAVAVDQPLKKLTKVPMFLHSNTGVLDSIKLDFVKHLTFLIKECKNIKCTIADSFMLSYFSLNFQLGHLMPINFLDPLNLLNTKTKSVKIHYFIITITLIVFV